MPVTAGPFTLTHSTLRTLTSSSGIVDVGNVLGTVIADWAAGTFDASNYTISGELVDRVLNYPASQSEIRDVLATLIGDDLESTSYTAADSHPTDYVIDTGDTDAYEVAAVLATFLAVLIPLNACVVASDAFVPGVVAANVFTPGAVSGGSCG